MMHLKASVTIESVGLVDVSTIAPFGQEFYETCLFWRGGNTVVDDCDFSESDARAMHNRWTDPAAIAKAISDYTKIVED
ncbi:hypothetical protein [Mycobacterium sp. CnD-18-1]|uniref:hypothetical protein n=1 Tax=Mycobacterium sp. CnD-18-1 TaxID=2917744 RepID=UPI001EF1B60D|nr:hypothetical protein [Mycobacterium sp. CnD-18-1]MCG7607113.1 hypothetical protein [Mycobacterium sp. CnD-18-1]